MLIALVAVETLLLVLLSILMAGLLRTQAAILQELHGQSGHEDNEAVDFEALGGARGPRVAVNVAGETPDAQPVSVDVLEVGHDTLLAFLSTSCIACEEFWDEFREGLPLPVASDTKVVIVAKDRREESPSRIADRRPAALEVVHSGPAWTDYGVPMSPYFVLVEGASGMVQSEGLADSWVKLNDMITTGMRDLRLNGQGNRQAPAPSDPATPLRSTIDGR